LCLYYGIFVLIFGSYNLYIESKYGNKRGMKAVNRIKDDFKEILNLITSDSNHYSWKVNETAINHLKAVVQIEESSLDEISKAAEECFRRRGVLNEKIGFALLDVAKEIHDKLYNNPQESTTIKLSPRRH
jgi:hypothetical protein